MLKLKLKQIRKRQRKTQKEFSEVLGISQNYLSELENDKSFPSKPTLEKIAAALNLPVSKLLCESSNSK